MEHIKSLPGAKTVTRYLVSSNQRLREIISMVVANVNSAASRAAQALIADRDRVSDVSDHLDGEFIAELGLDQAGEIREINTISSELEHHFDSTVLEVAFKNVQSELVKQIADLAEREAEIFSREQDIERIITLRVDEIKAQIVKESTTARGFLESALAKVDKVLDKNKVTRFAYSTISVFQEEFFELQGTHDLEYITKLYYEVMSSFQVAKMVMGKDGKLRKTVADQFGEGVNQDLFLFFFKYYNELLDIYQEEEELPSTADEIARVFEKKKRDPLSIVRAMRAPNKEAKKKSISHIISSMQRGEDDS